VAIFAIVLAFSFGFSAWGFSQGMAANPDGPGATAWRSSPWPILLSVGAAGVLGSGLVVLVYAETYARDLWSNAKVYMLEGDVFARSLIALRGSLSEAEANMSQLSRVLDERESALAKLETQSAEYERLAAINADQAETVRSMLVGAFADRDRQDRRLQYLGWAISFILGVGSSLVASTLWTIFVVPH